MKNSFDSYILNKKNYYFQHPEEDGGTGLHAPQ
jgi:hypothetical protein